MREFKDVLNNFVVQRGNTVIVFYIIKLLFDETQHQRSGVETTTMQ